MASNQDRLAIDGRPVAWLRLAGSGQRRDLARRLLVLCFLPASSKLSLVERRPLHHEAQHPCRQAMSAKLSISITAWSAPYSAWKWGGLWSSNYIRMTMPKKRLISGNLPPGESRK